ncbi:hypothetical protein ABZ729_34630 [Streptomyces sp. NPDC006678]|uniref:hypothetical protein n=1 Tax=Streptomyces sp. NPDC006678 TaxID=3157185 RepID=UPI0033E64E72
MSHVVGAPSAEPMPAEPIRSHTFLGQMLDCFPEMREPVARKVRSAIGLAYDQADVNACRTDVYGLLWDLFNEVLMPALAADPGRERDEVLRRTFSFLERVAVSPERVNLDFLEGLTGDYLIGRDGPLSYAHAGPAVRATMIRACANWGVTVPHDWNAAPPAR